jgi:tetrahedral aminopeptidase
MTDQTVRRPAGRPFFAKECLMDVDAQFLRDLCLAPSPSGFEAAVQAVVRRRLEGVAEVQGDPVGNVWASSGPEDGPKVLAVAHADQIGMIVTHVDEDGYVRLDAIGWLDQQLLPGHTVLIHGEHGPVRGVVGKLPTHIVPDDQRGKAVPIREQFVDIGARDRAEALERVAVGDCATFDAGFHELSPGRFCSLAIDNRAGVYAVTRALELYEETGGKARLTAASSSHEETTYMGSRALGRRLQPDVAIVVDGTFTSDYPGADPVKISGDVKLGGGPVLNLGTVMNRQLATLARAVAADEGVVLQPLAVAGETLTDAHEVAAAGEAATLQLSIPMRYVHSTAEVADAADIEATARLIAAVARRIGEVYQPGVFVA